MSDMQSSGNKLLDAFTSALSSFGAREQYEDSRSDLARQGINTYNKQVGDRMVGLVMYLTSERDKVDAKKTLEENRISEDIFNDKLLKLQETAKNEIVAAIVSAGTRNGSNVGTQNVKQPTITQDQYGIIYKPGDTMQSPWQGMFMPMPASTNPVADLSNKMVVVPGENRLNQISQRGKQYNEQGQLVVPQSTLDYNKELERQARAGGGWFNYFMKRK